MIDPAVINVDWTVDGMTTTNAGRRSTPRRWRPAATPFSAKAYDNADDDLVRTDDVPELGHRHLLPLEGLGELGADGQLDGDQELRRR